MNTSSLISGTGAKRVAKLKGVYHATFESKRDTAGRVGAKGATWPPRLGSVKRTLPEKMSPSGELDQNTLRSLTAKLRPPFWFAESTLGLPPDLETRAT